MSMVWPSSATAAGPAPLGSAKRRIARNSKRMKESFMPESLSHGADFVRLNLVEDSDLARLAEGVNGLAQIFLRKLVDVVVGAVFGNFDDSTANLQVAIRVRGILERNRDAWIAADVFVLHAALG